MYSPIEAVKLPAQPVICLRTHIPVQELPGLIGQTYGRIMQYLAENGEEPASMPYVAYYDLNMENLDIEIGFPVARELPGQGDLQLGCIPAGTYAQCLYTGPYEQMAPAYEALAQWIKENGYEATGTAYEAYLNGPNDTLPEGLQTQISFPLKG